MSAYKFYDPDGSNPVNADIVDELEDYKYSSAKDYLGKKGLLPVKKIE